jgi:hypothetical protein
MQRRRVLDTDEQRGKPLPEGEPATGLELASLIGNNAVQQIAGARDRPPSAASLLSRTPMSLSRRKTSSDLAEESESEEEAEEHEAEVQAQGPGEIVGGATSLVRVLGQEEGRQASPEFASAEPMPEDVEGADVDATPSGDIPEMLPPGGHAPIEEGEY